MNSTNGHTSTAHILLNRHNFSSNNFNCQIQSNAVNISGGTVLEIISTRDIQPNEQIICWFSNSYLDKIKSKQNLFLDTIFINIESIIINISNKISI